MKKQTEGDNIQRRSRARDAREAGDAPSSEGVTTGASKQRRHLGSDADHAEKVAGPGWGKQQPDRAAIDAKPGSLPPERESVSEGRPPRPSTDRQRGQLTEAESRAFEAIVAIEQREGPPSAAAIARETGLPAERVAQAVIDLVHVHDVVVERSEDDAGTGPVYQAKTRV